MEVNKLRFLLNLYDSLTEMDANTRCSIHLDKGTDSVSEKIYGLRNEVLRLLEEEKELL